jgi:hypothetical protein
MREFELQIKESEMQISQSEMQTRESVLEIRVSQLQTSATQLIPVEAILSITTCSRLPSGYHFTEQIGREARDRPLHLNSI